MKKRILSLFLALAMVLTMLPTDLRAKAATTPFIGWSQEITPTSGNVSATFNTSKGYATDFKVCYVDANDVVTVLPFGDLSITTNGIVDVYADDANSTVIYIETLDWGSASVSYTISGQTYTMDIASDIFGSGYYAANSATKENWITEFTVTKTDESEVFYFIANPNDASATLSDWTPTADLLDIANVQLSADSKCYTVTIKDKPNGGDYGFEIIDAASGESIANNYITLNNGVDDGSGNTGVGGGGDVYYDGLNYEDGHAYVMANQDLELTIVNTLVSSITNPTWRVGIDLSESNPTLFTDGKEYTVDAVDNTKIILHGPVLQETLAALNTDAFTVEVSAEEGFTYEHTIFLRDESSQGGEEEPALKFRCGEWENDTIVENTDWGLEDSMYACPGDQSHVFFYYMEDGVETMLSVEDLTSSNPAAVEISTSPVNSDAVMVEAVDFGSSVISYTVDENTYTVEITVGLPEFGFYSQPVADTQYYINEFTVTETNKTFYFVTNGDWKLTDVTLEDSLADIATVTLSEDQFCATITVTGTPNNEWGYSLRYDTVNMYDSNDTREDDGAGISLRNGMPSLMYRHAEYDEATEKFYENTENSLESSIYLYPGNGYVICFYYVFEGEETRLSLADVVSSDEDVVTLAEDPNTGVIYLDAVGFGTANMEYTVNGKTYSLVVTVGLPEFGFYTTPAVTQSGYVREFTVTDTEKTLYFVAQSGYGFDTLTPNDALADIATVELNADRDIATITFTGIPDEEEMYGFDFTFVTPDGWMGDGSDHINILNGTSVQLVRVEVFFELNDGSIVVSDGVNTEETGSCGDRFVAGTTVRDTGLTFADPVFWDSTRGFEGWIVCSEQLMSDEEGNTWSEWVQIDGTGLMTTAEMMDYVIPEENIVFMVQWAGDDADYYTDVFLDIYGGEFSFLENADDPSTEQTSDNWGCRFRKTPDYVGKTLYDVWGDFISKEPAHEAYTFEGWLQMDGEFNLVSKTIYTTKQILGIDPLADGSYLTIQADTVIYIAKWKELPMSSYGSVEVEVEDLPVVDPEQPVEEVTVGVEKKKAESALSGTVQDIIQKVLAGNESDGSYIVSEAVDRSIILAITENKDLTISTTVNIDPLTETDLLSEEFKEDAEKIAGEAEKLGDLEVAQYMDLTVVMTTYLDGQPLATGAISELSEAMVFTVVLPEELKTAAEGYARKFYIIYVHDGIVDSFDVSQNEDGTISFPASKFSTYALAYKDSKAAAPSEPAPQPTPQAPSSTQKAPQTTTQSPATGDTASAMLYIALVMISAAVLWILWEKKKGMQR